VRETFQIPEQVKPVIYADNDSCSFSTITSAAAAFINSGYKAPFEFTHSIVTHNDCTAHVLEAELHFKVVSDGQIFRPASADPPAPKRQRTQQPWMPTALQVNQVHHKECTVDSHWLMFDFNAGGEGDPPKGC
jgi:hypothetical protein